MADSNKPYSKKMRNDLTASLVRSILHYDPVTGTFTRNKTLKIAGFIRKKDGYRQIKINGVAYLAHRLAYLYIIGNWPEFEIDHKDGRRANNRWKNLRPATYLEQSRNAAKRKNATHLKGVVRRRNGAWYARIRVNKRLIYLGTRPTEKEAHKLYKKAASFYFKAFARFD